MVDVGAIILTYNEEDYIIDCINHLRPFVDYILVWDNNSTDNTVLFAEPLVNVVLRHKFSGSFAEERNEATKHLPKSITYVLHVDADERFDPYFLKSMKQIILENNSYKGFQFPRINLPDGKNYPDFQVRLLKRDPDIEWRRELHEVPYSKSKNKPLAEVGVKTLEWYPILHLPRNYKKQRSWW